MPTDEEINTTIETHLSTIGEDCVVELGFFGGTFTGIPLQEQEHLLSLVQPYLKQGRIRSIRISTRPDYIDKERVDLLRNYGVNTVELGVQSLNNEVLQMVRRGYDEQCVYRATRMLQQENIEVGMQMMIGLPGDTLERSVETAEKIINAGATNTRIYPTLVVKDTVLAHLYEQGLYHPLSIDQAVEWTAKVLPVFEEAGVTVLRVGLHPTEGFIKGSDYLAGPFHVSFRELVETRLWRNQLMQKLELPDIRDDVVTKTEAEDCRQDLIIHVAPSCMGAAAGYKGANKAFLSRYFRNIRFVASPDLEGRTCKLFIDQKEVQ